MTMWISLVVRRPLALLILLVPRWAIAAETPAEPVIAFHVVDHVTGKPIEQVSLSCDLDKTRTQAFTDARGDCLVPIPSQQLKVISAHALKEGYCLSKTSVWSRTEPPEPLPRRLELRLRRPAPIGGVVRTLQGDPIPGARVVVEAGDKDEELHPNTYYPVDTEPVETDAKGNWTCNRYPGGTSFFFIRVTHPRFAKERFSMLLGRCDDQERHQPGPFTLDDLQRGRAVIRMREAVSSQVPVLDAAGGEAKRPLVRKPVASGPAVTVRAVDAATSKPIPHFRAAPVQDREGDGAWTGLGRVLESDWVQIDSAEGQGQIMGVNAPGRARVAVDAPGYRPALSPVDAPPSAGSIVELKLEASRGIEGRVENGLHQPVAGAAVHVWSPRRQGAPVDLSLSSLEKEHPDATTDARGAFSLPELLSPFLLLVVHTDGIGFAGEAHVRKSGIVNLFAWSPLKVLIRSAAGPRKECAGLIVFTPSFELDPGCTVSFEENVLTDAAGAFTVLRGIPGAALFGARGGAVTTGTMYGGAQQSWMLSPGTPGQFTVEW